MMHGLDESMFEDIHEIAENSAYLKAVEEKDVSLEMLEQLPPYEELRGLEEKLRFESKLSFDSIFNEPTGYYMIKCFLIADYAVDKAIFIKDVEAYKSMRFESARRKVAMLLYQRFVATDDPASHEFKPGSSVFQIIQQHKGEDKPAGGVVMPGLGVGPASHGPKSSGGLEKSDNDKKMEKTVVSSNMPSQSHLMTQMSATTGHGAPGGAGDEFGGGGGAGGVGGVPGPGGVARSRNESTFQMGTNNNPIGVYGRSVRVVKERVMRGEAPKDLFDEVARDVMTDLKLDVYPRFQKSDFYRKYIRTKWIETQKVTTKDFTTFRVLGRGGFGAVHACRKKNSGQIYAMKQVNKKLVKVKSALDNVLEERNVLTMMKSNFVTNLKYALQDEETLLLIMDLMCGGDLKFHLINAGRFTEKRARFYAAQVLLGLEHVHKMSIIYRDMKLENVLLDGHGHCRLSDLGLAVVTKVKIKGYAGTPGYCFTANDHELFTARGFMDLDSVLAHFADHATLDVACWVAGRLEFHAITPDKVTVADAAEDDPLDLVEFRCDEHNISLKATAGHRMFGRIIGAGAGADEGRESAARIHTAREVHTAGQKDAEALFQLPAAFAQGQSGDESELPFAAALGLQTDDQIDAFLWLYGYWLGNGWLEGANACIAFGPKNPQDLAALDAAFARLPLPMLDCIQRGSHGYIRAEHPNAAGQLCFYICADSWWQYFAGQYGAAASSSGRPSEPVAAVTESSSQHAAEEMNNAMRYWDWVWRLSGRRLRLILAGQRCADGDVAVTAKAAVHGGTIYTSSPRLRDEIVAACIRAGYTASFEVSREAGVHCGMDAQGAPTVTRHSSWAVRYTCDGQRIEPIICPREHTALHAGVVAKVWCVTVPTKEQLIMVRRITHKGPVGGDPIAVSTPVVVGNTAPEMIKNKLYGPAADIFSYGVMLYRMLCGSKPFKGKVDRDLDKAVIERKPQFPKEIFSKEAISLLTGLLQKRPENRLGCGEKGIDEIKEHPFFESIDWGLLEAGYIDPPFVPNKFDVNAASLKDIGDFDRNKYKHVKLDERFKQRIRNFEYCSAKALQDEMVLVLEKADENVNFEKFAHQPEKQEQTQVVANGPCCSIA